MAKGRFIEPIIKLFVFQVSPVGVMAVGNQENQVYTPESAATSHGFEVSLTEILPKLKDNET